MTKSAFMGGSLSFKGDRKKSKKKRKSKHKIGEEGHEGKKVEELESPGADNSEMTDAERRAMEKKRLRQREENKKIAQKSHRERVEDLNEKLGSLTELNDIPRNHIGADGRMSHRAIQRLRQERASEEPDPEEVESDDEDDDGGGQGASGFAMMLMDDSSDEDSEEEEDEDEEGDSDTDGADQSGTPGDGEDLKSDMQQQCGEKTGPKEDQGVEPEPTEDLEALLEEFKVQDDQTSELQAPRKDLSSHYDIITSGMDVRDLDIDFVMRTSLLGGGDDSTNRGTKRSGRQASVFGPARDNWPKPPHFVGGGMGMTSYDNDSSTHPLPWPYSEMKEGDKRCPEMERWFQFTYSDNYKNDCSDFETIKASGDANALALFISHHPYVVEALQQLSSVLYQTNQSQEGLSLLKRALFVYESASVNSFLKVEGRVGFMDCDRGCNKLFFSTLFRMVRVSHVAGLPRASLAVSRFLLSLDPLRDPMAILLAMDYFALATNNERDDSWIVDLIESGKVTIWHRDCSNDNTYQCELLNMPNWAFSYALALYRISIATPSSEATEKADNAIKFALSNFPSVLEQLLAANEVDITGRSFQTDWPAVLPYMRDRSSAALHRHSDAASADPVVRACTTQACDLIVRIWLQQGCKLWSHDSVSKWIFKNVAAMKDSATEGKPLSPALMRYARCDAAEYEDKFQTMPAEANPLDPGLVANALHVDTNRPRLMQRMARGGGGLPEGMDMMAHQQGALLAGGPTEMIDPDWPLLEVFWRSALPWAHVEGVPPPPHQGQP